ncbi:14796_t:CDS:2 [Rhizophagus irregularis]|nr:14796_t:CDS:2 [Rhizophagus irregularis]
MQSSGMSCTNSRKERERFHYLKGQPFDVYSRLRRLNLIEPL